MTAATARATPETPAPAAAQPAKPARAALRAPALLEAAYVVSILIVLLVSLITAALSVASGAAAWLTAVRAGAATLVVGLLLWILNYQLMPDGLKVAVDDWMAKREKDLAKASAAEAAHEPALSTQEWKA